MALNYFICVTESSSSSLRIAAAQEYVLVDTHKSLNVGISRLNQFDLILLHIVVCKY